MSLVYSTCVCVQCGNTFDTSEVVMSGDYCPECLEYKGSCEGCVCKGCSEGRSCEGCKNAEDFLE